MKERSNSGLELTTPDAAQSVLRTLCLLSGFAAQANVSAPAKAGKRWQVNGDGE
jgi:hypothetical protein